VRPLSVTVSSCETLRRFRFITFLLIIYSLSHIGFATGLTSSVDIFLDPKDCSTINLATKACLISQAVSIKCPLLSVYLCMLSVYRVCCQCICLSKKCLSFII